MIATLHTSEAQDAARILLPSYVMSFEYGPSVGASDAQLAGCSWTADCRPGIPRAYCENCRQLEADWSEWACSSDW